LKKLKRRRMRGRIVRRGGRNPLSLERTKPSSLLLGAALFFELFTFGEAGRKLGRCSVRKEILLGSLPQCLR